MGRNHAPLTLSALRHYQEHKSLCMFPQSLEYRALQGDSKEILSRLLSNKLLGKVTQKPPMLPHETLLRPVHPFLGKSPITLTAGNRAWNKLGLESLSPLVSLRGSSTMKEVVTDLSDCLRLCHRKNVEWCEPTPSQRTESVLIGLIVHYRSLIN
jgi:hypothetical protein